MEKIIFENAPSTNTPINASNLNQIQDNVEKTINSIIESGTNDNGNWVKFADGTMICTGIKSYNATSDFTKDDIIFHKDLGEYVFPIEFVDVPVVNVTNVNSNYTRRIWLGGITDVTKTKIGHINICTYWNASDADGYLHIQAIGRWE